MAIARREFLAAVSSTAAIGSTSDRLLLADEPERWREKLASHKIKSIEKSTVQMKWPRQVGKNSRLNVHGRGPRVRTVKLTTDQGMSGWGALRGNGEPVDKATAMAKGRSLADLFDPAVGIRDSVLAPFDFALHDLAGVILDMSVYKMLGAAGPKATDCYSGMIYFDDLEPPTKPAGIEKVLANCQADIDDGYQQLKVKIGRGNRWMQPAEGLRRDIEVTRAIAETFPGTTILVDGNDGFSVASIIKYLEGIGDIPLLWIEEPFREKVTDYRRLRQWHEANNRQTLLADGEAGPDWPVLDQLGKQGLLDVQLVDVVGYGFTAWRRLMPSLIERKILASPHAWGHALKTNYVAHLAAGLGNVVTIEGVTCASDDVNFGQYRLHDGKLVVSEEPGFGMQLLQ